MVITKAPEMYTPELRTALLFSHSGLEKRKRRLFETSILSYRRCVWMCSGRWRAVVAGWLAGVDAASAMMRAAARDRLQVRLCIPEGGSYLIS